MVWRGVGAYLSTSRSSADRGDERLCLEVNCFVLPLLTRMRLLFRRCTGPYSEWGLETAGTRGPREPYVDLLSEPSLWRSLVSCRTGHCS